jgi:hypothetical protein
MATLAGCLTGQTCQNETCRPVPTTTSKDHGNKPATPPGLVDNNHAQACGQNEDCANGNKNNDLGTTTTTITTTTTSTTTTTTTSQPEVKTDAPPEKEDRSIVPPSGPQNKATVPKPVPVVPAKPANPHSPTKNKSKGNKNNGKVKKTRKRAGNKS